MKMIVAPLDGSALAEQVLPYVQLYGRLLGAQVVLLRAVTDEEREWFALRHAAEVHIDALPRPGEPLEARTAAALTEQAGAYLAEQAQSLRRVGLHVTTRVGMGNAADCIAEVAHQHPDALVMLATHGYGGVRRMALGSTAEKVIHSTSAPVFLVRAGAVAQPPLGVRRVMVPLDGSELAASALPVATEIATAARAEIILLEAVMPLPDLAPGFAPIGRPIPVPGGLVDEEHERAVQQLTAVAGRLGRLDVPITPVAALGFPAEVILDEAARQGADLIVMATHGRSGVRRLVLGSVAGSVLHGAHVPLLLVRSAAAEREYRA